MSAVVLPRTVAFAREQSLNRRSTASPPSTKSKARFAFVTRAGSRGLLRRIVWYNITMKLPALILLLPTMAFGVTVESLPPPQFIDTEVSTNIPFEVSFDAMSRMNFSISLDASPSNCVEVSIGEDANADGNLSPEESAYTFGFNCGRWFKRSAAEDSETTETDNRGQPLIVTSGHAERNFLLKKRKLDESWNLVKVTRRGKAEVCELATVEGAKPGAALIVR